MCGGTRSLGGDTISHAAIRPLIAGVFLAGAVQAGVLVTRSGKGLQFTSAASGLEQLRSAAGAGEFPPADFMLAAGLRIRKRLEAPDGAQYFETLRVSPLPRLKGAVVRFSPPRRPNEIVLALRGTAAEEVILKLTSPFSSEAAPGVLIEFEGMADSFTSNPFALTVVAERGKVEGWPAGVSPSPPRQ